MWKEDFNFYARTLRGVKEIPPRWKRCVTLVDRQLGEALGQEYVSRTLGRKLKADALRMTLQIEAAMAKDIAALDWMTPATKKRALDKLHTIVNKIGYPDKWRDYSKLEIRPAQYVDNVERANQFEVQRQLAKIGKPLDRTEWFMTPPTVNAYYNPQMNDINFPAGILQPPLYDPAMDDAPNYGNTGATIGHELTHGFDDEGRQFDAKGNLKEWWTAKDDKEFNRRAQCIVDQYAEYTIVDDIKINSKLTLGEDIADLGGLVLAWMAWKAESADKSPEARDWTHPGAALLCRQCTVGVRKRSAGEPTDESGDRSALATALSGQWADGQHAGVREGLHVQARPAHGPRGSLPCVVGHVAAWADSLYRALSAESLQSGALPAIASRLEEVVTVWRFVWLASLLAPGVPAHAADPVDAQFLKDIGAWRGLAA